MRTRRRKTIKRRRRRRFYKRRRGTRRRRRRRGRMTRGRRRGGSKMAEAEAVGRLAMSVKSGKTSKVDGAKELFSIVESGKGGKKGRGAQLPITVLCDSADVVADAACEIVGLGPEDPLADVCAYEMLTHIAKWCKNFISKHEPSALKRILNNPMNIVKVLAAKKKGSSVLSSMAVKSGHMGVEV